MKIDRKGRIEVLIGGYGGQGIVLAGTLMAKAASLKRRYVSQAASYGPEARGSACRSEVILSDTWIDFPRVVEVDVMISMAQQAYDAYSPYVVADGGVIIHDSALVKPNAQRPARHCPIDATGLATSKLNASLSSNMIMLGAFCSICGIIEKKDLIKVFEESFSESQLSQNLRALDLGEMAGLETADR